jgi:hypothetical protein
MEEENQSPNQKENAPKFTKRGRRIYDFGKPYIPELDYASRNYKPFGDDKEHFCARCKDYYADLYESGITKKPFPPNCEGDIAEKIRGILQENKDLIDDEDVEFLLYKDPITFAAGEFNWAPRWYQKNMLRCTSLKKVARAGRRCGKSAAMAVKIAHVLYIYKNRNNLVICPYQSQVKRVFEIIRTDLLSESQSYRECVAKDNTSAPQVIELSNGSKVTGFSSGAKSGGKSTQIRGQDAHAIFLDEMDYLSEDDFEAVLAILASHPECLIWASSTPTGARSQFFDWCTNKNLGFKEFHFISAESPSWTQDTEDFLKERYSEAGYAREFLAEFGDETAGVFKNSDINASLKKYRYEDCKYNHNLKYVMGVDWNEVAGVHIVVTELSRGGPGGVQYKVVYREVVERQQFTQLRAVDRIIDIDNHWHCEYIYVDAGFGHCVGPDTLIHTDKGMIEIKDIKAGDKVLTHDGLYRNVLDKVIAKEKESYKIKPSKCLETTVSYCHPFLTYRTVDRFNDKEYEEKNLQWRTAESIDVDKDFIAIAKKREKTGTKKILDILSLDDSLQYDEDYVWSKFSNRGINTLCSKESLSREFNVSKSTIDRIKSNIKNGKELNAKQLEVFKEINKVHGENWINSEILKFNRYVDVSSYDFQTVLGWYLSEGNINKGTVEFCQNIDNNINEFEDFIRAAKSIFPSVSVYRNESKIRVFIHGNIAVSIFEYIGGKYCYGKRIHEDYLDIDHWQTIKCVFYGDGHIKNSSIQCSLTSFQLIDQIRQKFIDNNILPSIYKVSPRHKNHLPQLRIDISGNQNEINVINRLLDLNLSNSDRVNRKKYITLDNYILVPVDKFYKIDDQKGLIDIEVEGSHSFCGNGFILHNTQVEMLHKYGIENPNTRMHKRVKAVTMQSKILIRDPVTGEEVKKDVKPFMVSVAARQMETRRCILPEAEDTNVNLSEEGEVAANVGIAQQMRNFKVEKISKSGMPTYSQGFEHTLTAWMLSIMGFFLEFSDVNRVNYNLQVFFANRFGEKPEESLKDNPDLEKQKKIEHTKKLKKKYIPKNRGMSNDSFFRIGRSHSTKAVLQRDRRLREMQDRQNKDRGFISSPKPTRRKTF